MVYKLTTNYYSVTKVGPCNNHIRSALQIMVTNAIFTPLIRLVPFALIVIGRLQRGLILFNFSILLSK